MAAASSSGPPAAAARKRSKSQRKRWPRQQPAAAGGSSSYLQQPAAAAARVRSKSPKRKQPHFQQQGPDYQQGPINQEEQQPYPAAAGCGTGISLRGSGTWPQQAAPAGFIKASAGQTASADRILNPKGCVPRHPPPHQPPDAELEAWTAAGRMPEAAAPMPGMNVIVTVELGKLLSGNTK